MRRQNRSCDQCRKAKRACDAPTLHDNFQGGPTAGGGTGENVDGKSPDEEYIPCSYCVRTNKRCTLNWARTQRQVAEAASAARPADARRPKRMRTASTDFHLGAVRLTVSPALPTVTAAASDADADAGTDSDTDGIADEGTVATAARNAAGLAAGNATGNSAAVPGIPNMPDASVASCPDNSAAVPAPVNPQPFAFRPPVSAADICPPIQPYWDPIPQDFARVGDASTFSAFPGTSASTSNYASGISAVGLSTLPLFEPGAGHDTAPTPVTYEGTSFTNVPPQPQFSDLSPTDPAFWALLPLSPTQMRTACNSFLGISSPDTHSPAMNSRPASDAPSAVQEDHGQSRGQDHNQYPGTHPTFASSARNYGQLQRTERFPPSSPPFSLVTCSPSSLEQLLATRTNGRAISESLLQIYHDVLEHNFSCWVTEATCPYKGWSRSGVRSLRSGPAGLPASSSNSSSPQNTANGDSNHQLKLSRRTPQEMGPQWSNRIYHRVTRLDQMAQAAGLVNITPAQSQASQRALDLVIMAFATQWAQGSRQREAYATDFADFANMADMGSEEFDRSLQRALWEQARQALQDSADVESYRMVCAELIFGFVQRPWMDSDAGVAGRSAPESRTGTSETTGQTQTQSAAAARANILSSLEDILDKDGPPIFTERAARKIHNLKYRFDCYEAQMQERREQQQEARAAGGYPSPEEQISGDECVSSEDTATVGLLYWLAVMIDTIHASIHERPVVLADEDSQHDAAADDDEDELVLPDDLSSVSSQSSPGMVPAMFRYGSSRRGSGSIYGGSSSGSNNNSQRWRIDLFIQDNPERQSTTRQQRWPCSYDGASMTIARSAPVKVLLYRYVHYLQKLLRSAGGIRYRIRNGSSSERSRAVRAATAVEDTVSETLLVYRYWNVTYGAFYRDIIRHYGSVPSRIRGWSVCIAAHWHLASIMLADVLEDLDARGYGLDEARAMRCAANTVATIRHSSAVQLSDLARMATPMGFSSSQGGFPGTISMSGVPGLPDGFSFGDSEPQLPDFHFAVREGTILTEPWSMLLIRAFSRAAMLHLREYDERQLRLEQLELQQQQQQQTRQRQPQGRQREKQQQERRERRDGLQRCEDCVQALWLLGKKSDMARSAATVLSRAMRV